MGPLLELLHDPGELANRGVVQSVRERLGTAALDLEVRVTLGEEPVQTLEAGLLGVGKLRERGLVDLAERYEAHGGRVHVHAHDVIPINPAQIRRDERPEVAALRPVSVVTEASHQLGESPGDPKAVPAWLTGWPREPKPWQRGDDEVEGVRRVAAVRTWVGQRSDYVQELDHRARPPVAEDQREGTRLGRAHVQEVNVLPVYRGGELRIPVELGLVLSPIVGRTPILGQLPEVVQRDTAVPARARDPTRPTGAVQPVPEIVQVFLRDVYPERKDLGPRAIVGNGRNLLSSVCIEPLR